MDWTPSQFGELVPVIQRVLDELELEPMLVRPSEILAVLSGDDPSGGVAEAWSAYSKTGQVPPGLPAATRLALSLRLRAALWYCNDTAYHVQREETAAEILTDLVTNYWDTDGRYDWIQEDLLVGDHG